MAPGTTRALTRRYSLVIGLLELAIAVPLPVLVLHMTGRGLDLAIIGLAFTIRAILVVLLELPTGGLADAIGRRPIALASQLFTAASFLALLFVSGPFLALVYALLQGVGAALHSGALDAWYVDELKRLEPEVELQPHLASVRVYQSVGMLAGTALGGFLPRLTAHLDLGFPLSDFGIALFAGVVLRLVVWLMTFVLVREPVKPQGAEAAGVAAVPTILKDAFGLSRSIPQVRWLLVAAFASGLAMVSIETFWQPIAALTFGAEASNSLPFGVLGTLSGVALLGGSLAVMRWGKRFPGGPAALAGFSTLLRGAAILAFAVMTGSVGLGFTFALVYFALATWDVPHDTLLHDAVPSARRSSMMSVHSLVFFGGIALASGPLGWLATTEGPRLALGIAGILTIASALAYAMVARHVTAPAAKANVVAASASEPEGGAVLTAPAEEAKH